MTPFTASPQTSAWLLQSISRAVQVRQIYPQFSDVLLLWRQSGRLVGTAGTDRLAAAQGANENQPFRIVP